MEDKDATYERLRGQISKLNKSPDASARRLAWVADNRSLAVARDTVGRLEVFIEGDPLTAASKPVADILEHQTWKADDDSDLAATRVILPPGDHFDQFGALLCVELVVNEVGRDPQAAFAAVEPLIALALTRESVTDLTLMGLVGELAFLERLLAVAQPIAAKEILSSWAGSAPSSRDFQLGSVGVEVKTTQGSASIHHVEGIHQVELGSSNQGVIEDELFMLSLGIGWISDDEQGTSLPELVDAVLAHLGDADDRADLLARIKQYGGDAAIGYDHERDMGRPRYASRFYFRFERLYDMTDDRIKVLTRRDLEAMDNVDPGSVAFRVVLKDRIRGEHNPITGWQDLVLKALASARIPRRVIDLG